jgi:uncharacterized membrane protein YcaP (DUF421 family)
LLRFDACSFTPGRTSAAWVVSTTVFLLIVALLRIVGPQALAKMSGYDVVATITLGSIIAAVSVTRNVSVSEGVAALVTLLLLQEAIRWFQSRYLTVHHLVRQPPRVMLWAGVLLEDRLRENSVSAEEIRAAVRKAGLRSLSDARWSCSRTMANGPSSQRPTGRATIRR